MRPQSNQHLSRKRKWDTTGVMLDESALAGPVDLTAVFGNDRLAEAEIGSGKGTFLIDRATARPDLNLLGIEYARAYCMYTADRIRRHGLTNVRMICADAAALFRDCLADESLWRVYVYFPDPWPKRRHRRRRLIQASFVEQVHRTLKPGGQLLIVTDHMEYFRQIQRVLSEVAGLASIQPPGQGEMGQIVGTNFERKYIAEGRRFYAAARMKYL